MTTEEKKEITRMRKQAMGYTEIADALGISKDTVKTYCKRNNLGGVLAANPERKAENACLECGKPIVQEPKHKPKKFCCKECRQKWWNAHPEKVTHKALYEFSCPNCGVSFSAYGNSKRKYCSHQCYISARFNGGAKA